MRVKATPKTVYLAFTAINAKAKKKSSFLPTLRRNERYLKPIKRSKT